MNKSRMIVNALALLAFSLGVTLNCHAQSDRAWVSTGGSDTNPCSEKQPCRTFGAAIAAVRAGGEVAALDSGEYGPVVIAKSVTLSAPVGVRAVVPASTRDSVQINAGASDTVTLRNLHFINKGTASNGVYFYAGGVLNVEGCVAEGFHGNGIYLYADAKSHIKNTTVRGNAYSGIEVWSERGPSQVLIEDCRMEKNGAVGVRARNNARVTVRNSVSSDNAVGFTAHGTGQINIESCVVTGNQLGKAA